MIENLIMDIQHKCTEYLMIHRRGRWREIAECRGTNRGKLMDSDENRWTDRQG